MAGYLSEKARSIKLSPIREIFELASRTPDLISLEVGQPDFPTPPHIIEKAMDVLHDGHVGYTESAGIIEARQAVAKRLKEDYDLDFDPGSEIVICSGANSAISCLLRSIIDHGAEVLFPDPGWPQYRGMIEDTDGVPVQYPLDSEKGFCIDFNKLESLITPLSKAIIVNTPSNPTGGVIDESQLRRLLDLISDRDILIIFDQAYDKILYGKQHTSIASLEGSEGKVVTIGSASKNYAMCGWRVGYAAGPAEIMEEVMKFQSLITICPSYVSQVAAVAAFGGTQEPTRAMKEEFHRRRDFFVRGLNEIPGFRTNVPDGAFYTFTDITAYGMDDWEFTHYLINEVGVTCIPGSPFGDAGKGFVRFSYANSMENLEEALNRFETRLKKL